MLFLFVVLFMEIGIPLPSDYDNIIIHNNNSDLVVTGLYEKYNL